MELQKAVEHGLAFLALLSFFFTFIGSRVFTTLYPDVIVSGGGIHFHHFWYGIILVAFSGGLSLAYQGSALRRVLAITYGAGLGLIGDEVGLLLTFGDYRSLLTYEVVLGTLAAVLMAILAIGYRRELQKDLIGLAMGERLMHVGTFIAALSALFAAFGNLLGCAVVLASGVLLVALGGWMHRSEARGSRDSAVESRS